MEWGGVEPCHVFNAVCAPAGEIYPYYEMKLLAQVILKDEVVGRV